MSVAPNTPINTPHNSTKSEYTPTCLEANIMSRCLKFFSKDYNLKQMLPIICGADDISLQMIDWSATNYAKETNLSYSIKKILPDDSNSPGVREFVVYNDYKSCLKSYTKELFDPFCRGDKIYFEYSEGEGIETSVGQLNFFHWAIENKFLDWIRTNIDLVNEHKRQTKLRHKEMMQAAKENNANLKKRELIVSASKTISQQDVKVTIKFD